MRYLIFTLALISAFFVSADVLDNLYDMNDLKPPKSDGLEICISAFGNEGCARTLTGAYLAACNLYKSASGLPPDQSDKKYTRSECANISNSDTNPPQLHYYGIRKNQFCPGGWCAEERFGGTPITWSNQYERKSWYCPPEGFPEHENSVTIEPAPTDPLAPTFMCAKLLGEPEPDPDCPAPTDNDPFVFGSGGGQTSVCFPAPNGRQCEIQTDENGGYYIPASYGSAEPVSCVPDIDPSPDPDPTPDPEPKPDPDPTDPEPETTELDAINKINENLDVINNNQKTYSESNDERLDRIALEIQNSNQILSDIKSKPVSGGGAYVNNAALGEIAENTKKDLYNGECEGELCDYDIQPNLDEENAKLKEWIEKEEPAPSILNTYTSKITSYVSQNFAGFTGSCKPFILDVSIANVSKTINVHQHCEPYETYFKPLVEWLLWTFTAIALINISSQAFRAFSSL